MGKEEVSTTAAAAAATEMKTTKKKKGRPPSKNNNPVQTPPPKPNSNRRSTRRNPNHFNFDDDDERKEKKVKLVVRLPESGDNKIAKPNQTPHSQDYDSGSESGSGSDSDPESEDQVSYAKKRKINGGSTPAVVDQEVKAEKAINTPPHGSPLESGPTTPLPEKKLLVFILDRLQKKDTYGVFSEPVDPSELPDYFEIIEQPMDFGTLRKKLDGGAYKNLEELEADVFLICSNAMQYNAPDTVYHRQARTIQDIAKRDFENLRHEGEDGEPQPKVVRRGRPPNSKNQKKPLETSHVDRVVNELSSGETPASGEDKANGSNSYNLRKPSTVYRFRPTDQFVSSQSHRLRNGDNYSEWVADWNDEFPASILRADMKYGKKHFNFTVDENRRDTYKQSLSLSSSNNSPALFNSIGDMKRLVPVGLQEPLAYARSLARYAANLGPVAWKMASKKIESLLPDGVQYGPGWVGSENQPGPSNPFSFSSDKQKSSNSTNAGDCSSSKLVTPSTSDLNSAIAYAPSEGTKLSVHQNPVHRNGFNGTFANNNVSTEESKMTHGEGQMWNFGKGLTQQRHNNNAFSVPPDLNVRVGTSSPSSSSLQIGSPQQPDLALQL